MRDALRLSGIDPRACSSARRPWPSSSGLEVLLGVGVVVLYGVDLAGAGLVVLAALAATVAVAATGTLYGALVSGLRVRETLLPRCSCPCWHPCSSAPPAPSKRRWPACPRTAGHGAASWPATAVLYAVAGALAYGTLLEGS